MNIFASVPFILSSAFTLYLSYIHLPTKNSQQAIAVLLIVILVLIGRYPKLAPNSFLQKGLRILLIAISSLIVQLLVFSTGGFFSPFLILLHLYSLGTSLILNVSSSLNFLILSMVILILDIRLNPNSLALFRDDPWSVILYLTSFVVIIPLAQVLFKTYHLKDKLAKKLGDYLQIAETREESILKGLNELVIVTDINLKIISINLMVEKIVGAASSEVIGKDFLGSFNIRDKNNKGATIKDLSVGELLSDKQTRIIKDMFLITKKRPKPIRVNIQIRPIVDTKGLISQIVFVITDTTEEQLTLHADLEPALQKLNSQKQDLKKQLISNDPKLINSKIELFSKSEEDLLVAQELEDHPIAKENTLSDIAAICKKAVLERMEFSKSLGVNLMFNLSELDYPEASYLHLLETTPEVLSDTISSYTKPVNVKWFRVLIMKLIDIAILMSSSAQNSSVLLSLSRKDPGIVQIEITGFQTPPIDNQTFQDIFIQYYGRLDKITNLHLGSGLEGFIVKNIVDQLDIPLEAKAEKSPNQIKFKISFGQGPQNETQF